MDTAVIIIRIYELFFCIGFFWVLIKLIISNIKEPKNVKTKQVYTSCENRGKNCSQQQPFMITENYGIICNFYCDILKNIEYYKNKNT